MSTKVGSGTNFPQKPYLRPQDRRRRMMRLILVLVCLGGMALPAQQLVFCLDHTRDGVPLAGGGEFELDQFGQELDLLFRNPRRIDTPKLYFFIDRMIDSVYVEHDTRSMMTREDQPWLSVNYRFDRTGRYRVLVLDADKAELCRAVVDVNVLRDVGGPSYYRDLEVLFCHQTQEGEPDTRLETISLDQQKNNPVKVLVKHFRPLRSKTIVIDIWKKGEEADEYQETLEFVVEEHWNFTQFTYPFKTLGTYFVRVYSEDDVWMGSGTLEID